MSTESDIKQAQREWLLKVIEEMSLPATKWAKLAGLTPTTVTRRAYPKEDGLGDSVLKLDTLTKLAEAAGVEVPDFTTSTQPVVKLSASGSASSDEVSIRRIDLRFGMGGGAYLDSASSPDDAVKVDILTFPRSWIRALTDAPFDKLVWASGMGDSMMPTIGPNDVVLIDQSQQSPVMRDQVWALSQYGEGMIKRLRATGEGYDILSDNQAVPKDYAADGSMYIVGRVVAVVKRL